jgi:acetylglutamate kinase
MTASTAPSDALPGALQAQVLHGVLPYLQSIHGKTFVVVCEGAVLQELPLRVGLARDVALLYLVGLRLVLLSGGARESLSALSHLHGDLVAAVNQHGCRAMGITGDDGGTAGLAGGLVQRLHAKGFLPVILPVVQNAQGQREAVDAGALAADLAPQLGAEKLLFIGDAAGAIDREGRLIADLSERKVKALRRHKAIAEPVMARLDAASQAVSRGVKSVHLIDGHRLHSLLLEVLGNSNHGTMVLPDRAVRLLDDSRRSMR